MIRRLVLALILLLPATLAPAGSKDFFNTGGVAIQGYDPVAYFKAGRAVEGRPEHAVKWGGALWYFASDDNRNAFEMNPRAYAPQYGGYCASGVAHGRIVPTEPEAFTIHDGKLYLHHSDAIRSEWRQDVQGNVTRANANWPAALGR